MKRKAFTLAELLIVIVVIGVLSTMMLFSSTSFLSSSRATKIIADLTTFKRALIHFYVDNHDKVKRNKNGLYLLDNAVFGVQTMGDLMKQKPYLVTRYIDNSQNKFDKDNYSVNSKPGTYRFEDSGQVNNRKSWFIAYTLTPSELSSGVGEKLAKKASFLKLYSSQGTTGSNKEGVNAKKVDIKSYNGEERVWMKVLDLE